MSDIEEIEEIEPYSFHERVLMLVCQYAFLLYLAFVFEIVLLVFATLSYLYADLNKATRSILMLDFAVLGVAVLVTTGLIRLCNKSGLQ